MTVWTMRAKVLVRWIIENHKWFFAIPFGLSETQYFLLLKILEEQKKTKKSLLVSLQIKKSVYTLDQILQK